MTRRLAAIFAADVVGYSKLMAEDEAGTLSALKAHRRDLFDPETAKHGGRIVKLMGDGVLAEFPSVVEAVECAVAIQTVMAGSDGKIALRIGINLGDVIIDGNDIYGDGVNVAARLEALAESGGICISGQVFDAVESKVDLAFDDLGPQQLKNIARPVRVWRWSPAVSAVAKEPSARALPERPSIAVLPFTNMSADAEQEFFTDGLTEDIITDLSNVPGLFVIARHSTFAFKGKSIDVRQIARDLGVKYILEGSARRAANRLRVNVQLIDAAGGGAHVFAERFDRNLVDVFDVQDEIARRVVSAVTGRLGESRIVERYRPSNLEAYDLCLRARHMTARSRSDTEQARIDLEQAIALDPQYPEAHYQLARVRLFLWLWFGFDKSTHLPAAIALARKAVELDPRNGNAHGNLGFILLQDGQWDEAAREVELGVSLSPDDPDCIELLADYKMRTGQWKDSLDLMLRAIRLNPIPPFGYYWNLGELQVELGRYADAIKTFDRPEIRNSPARRHLAAALVLNGNLERAKQEAAAFLSEYPDWTISSWYAKMAYNCPAFMQKMIQGYRLVGLPE